MIKLPVHIARKLKLVMEGNETPSSSMKHSIIHKMLEDGVLHQRIAGKNKIWYFTSNPAALTTYIHHHFGINSLDVYIEQHEQPISSRMENILAGSNSKLKQINTFKGFMLNSYSAVSATLHHKAVTILPMEGTCIFMNEYEHFMPEPSVTIVGVENAENFWHISRQAYLFKDLHPLFVSRYPQNNSLISWLKTIPNPYLHFGDLDFEGINIYLNEFKKHLGQRATYFIPPGFEILLEKYGNRELFNRQYPRCPNLKDIEPAIGALISLLLQKGKVLEQEIFIERGSLVSPE